jgi:hypothetical protein
MIFIAAIAVPTTAEKTMIAPASEKITSRKYKNIVPPKILSD